MKGIYVGYLFLLLVAVVAAVMFFVVPKPRREHLAEVRGAMYMGGAVFALCVALIGIAHLTSPYLDPIAYRILYITAY